MEMMCQERAGRWDGLCTGNNNGRRRGQKKDAIGALRVATANRNVAFMGLYYDALLLSARGATRFILPSPPKVWHQSFVNTFEIYGINSSSTVKLIGCKTQRTR